MYRYIKKRYRCITLNNLTVISRHVVQLYSDIHDIRSKINCAFTEHNITYKHDKVSRSSFKQYSCITMYANVNSISIS